MTRQQTSANEGVQSYDAAATRTTFASLVHWQGTWGYLPAYEANTSYAGDGAPAKQTVTTRSQDGYSTGTLTTYYVRSTVLGGKAVTELDASGGWKSSAVYVEGMKLASYVAASPSNTFSWHHMDPVTGNETSSDGGAYSPGFSQLDPLGSDVTFAPDPNVYEEPPYLDPTSVFSSPVENQSQAWAWEGDIAMANHVLRVNADYDRGRADYFWGHGRRDIAREIVSRNPNVGVEIRAFGSGWEYSGSVFGSQAAGFLTGLDRAIQSGLLVAANKPWYVFGFTAGEEGQINNQVKSMYSSEVCSKAFGGAGLESVKTMMDNGNLIFVHDKLLGTPSNDSAWLGNSVIRNTIRRGFRETLGTADVTPIGPQNGRYYVGFNANSFNGSIDTPQRVIIHALIHAGGAGGRTSDIFQLHHFPSDRAGTAMTREAYGHIRRPPLHDLEWMNYKDNKTSSYTGVYDGIMEACLP